MASVRLMKMNNHIHVSAALLLALLATGYADLTYNIDFDQFSAGTPYTTASGPPDDFSAYTANYSTNLTSATIVSSFGGLTDKPLLNTSLAASTFGIYRLDFAGTTNSVITLSLDLSLDANSDARINLAATNLPYINGIYAVFSSFTYEMSLGATHVPYTPNTAMTVLFSLNTQAGTYSSYLNGQPVLIDEAFDASEEINYVDIRLGDVHTVGHWGDGAMDNISLSINAVPEPRTLLLLLLAPLTLWNWKRQRRAEPERGAYG